MKPRLPRVHRSTLFLAALVALIAACASDPVQEDNRTTPDVGAVAIRGLDSGLPDAGTLGRDLDVTLRGSCSNRLSRGDVQACSLLYDPSATEEGSCKIQVRVRQEGGHWVATLTGLSPDGQSIHCPSGPVPEPTRLTLTEEGGVLKGTLDAGYAGPGSPNFNQVSNHVSLRIDANEVRLSVWGGYRLLHHFDASGNGCYHFEHDTSCGLSALL